ncbi:MAG: M23 family metallopeptidase [Bacteriovoracaceae bacterium]|nr:M23 family metallopeptidase [Bacteriovoracaceae bacterium]
MNVKHKRIWHFLTTAAILLATVNLHSCGDGDSFITGTGACNGYTAPASSEYILPYVVGEAYLLSQSNCETTTHYGNNKYAYDFSMEIGTTIVAIRSGTVIKVEESYEDDNEVATEANYIQIRHADGTVAIYVHLTQNGSDVSVDDTVSQGDSIGQSGNSGYSSGPHLHLQVNESSTSFISIPITFSNASPAPIQALVKNVIYTATSQN